LFLPEGRPDQQLRRRGLGVGLSLFLDDGPIDRFDALLYLGERFGVRAKDLRVGVREGFGLIAASLNERGTSHSKLLQVSHGVGVLSKIQERTIQGKSAAVVYRLFSVDCQQAGCDQGRKAEDRGKNSDPPQDVLERGVSEASVGHSISIGCAHGVTEWFFTGATSDKRQALKVGAAIWPAFRDRRYQRFPVAAVAEMTIQGQHPAASRLKRMERPGRSEK